MYKEQRFVDTMYESYIIRTAFVSDAQFADTKHESLIRRTVKLQTVHVRLESKEKYEWVEGAPLPTPFDVSGFLPNYTG